MTQDLNKRISSIQYNLLNLPTNMIYEVRMSEYYTSINENKIRAEHGLPLRRYYSVYANGAPYKPSLIPIYSIMPISIWGNSKMSF